MILLALYCFITIGIGFGVDIGDPNLKPKDIYKLKNILENVFLSPFVAPVAIGAAISTAENERKKIIKQLRDK